MMPTKKAKNIYSLVAKYSKNGMTGEEVIKIPCFDLLEKTQLSNIDLFTAHFEDEEELISFCKTNELVDKNLDISAIFVKCNQPYTKKGIKKYSYRPVLYSENKWVTHYALMDESKCNVLSNGTTNVELFIAKFLENYCNDGSLRVTLEEFKILYSTRGQKAKKFVLSKLSSEEEKEFANQIIEEIECGNLSFNFEIYPEEEIFAETVMKMMLDIINAINLKPNEKKLIQKIKTYNLHELKNLKIEEQNLFFKIWNTSISPLSELILTYPNERELLKNCETNSEHIEQEKVVKSYMYQIVLYIERKYRLIRDISLAMVYHKKNVNDKIVILKNPVKLIDLNELLGNPTPNPKIMDVETNKMFEPDKNPYSHTDGFDRPEVPLEPEVTFEQEVQQILTTDEQSEETPIDLNSTQNNPLEYPGQISMEEIIDEQESFGKQKRLVPPGPYIPTEE